ncbi:hypothetical protein B0H11DRAFT_1914324 [Mycena galericulata]|nr:hypothetical protein B0H11DRAFT_1914324 [Mycena galericulata]
MRTRTRVRRRIVHAASAVWSTRHATRDTKRDTTPRRAHHLHPHGVRDPPGTPLPTIHGTPLPRPADGGGGNDNDGEGSTDSEREMKLKGQGGRAEERGCWTRKRVDSSRGLADGGDANEEGVERRRRAFVPTLERPTPNGMTVKTRCGGEEGIEREAPAHGLEDIHTPASAPRYANGSASVVYARRAPRTSAPAFFPGMPGRKAAQTGAGEEGARNDDDGKEGDGGGSGQRAGRALWNEEGPGCICLHSGGSAGAGEERGGEWADEEWSVQSSGAPTRTQTRHVINASTPPSRSSRGHHNGSTAGSASDAARMGIDISGSVLKFPNARSGVGHNAVDAHADDGL